MTAFFNNQSELTDNLRVLTKFIQMEPQSPLAEKVTNYSNNQNGVRPRDFKSNNPIQIRLQNEFTQLYAGQYVFEIKRGETLGQGIWLSNEVVGLYLMAFDMKEPWATHRKYQVFEDKHADLFGRPSVTADRIVMCRVIMEAVEQASASINNDLCAKYVLTKYFLLYCVREVFDKDSLANVVLTEPETFVRRASNRDVFRQCVRNIIDDMVIDLNAEVDEYGDDFDYRDKMRDAGWVKDLGKKIVGNYQKLVNRKRIKSFYESWMAAQGAA